MFPEEIRTNEMIGDEAKSLLSIQSAAGVAATAVHNSATFMLPPHHRAIIMATHKLRPRMEPSDALADLDSIIPALNIDIPDIDFVPNQYNIRGIYKGETDAMMRARLVKSLSFSFPGSALSNALQFGSDQKCSDRLSSSCFAELRMDKIKLEEFDTDDDESMAILRANSALSGCLPENLQTCFNILVGTTSHMIPLLGGASRTWIDITSTQTDDDLTPLNWLQDADILKNFNGEPIKLDISRQEPSHPTNIPYNPQKHIKSKPPYSFSCLIFMAIEDYPLKRLPVKDIYNWMLRQFPYFVNAPTGWKNSVRHNLSLNRCFRKVDKDKGSSIGKGSLWMIDPIYRPNLLQALRKTPYHPFHQLQMMSANNPLQPPTSVLHKNGPSEDKQGDDCINNNNSDESNNNKVSPDLFPFLSKRLNQDQACVENHEDLDVANTLMEMKNTHPSRSTTRYLQNTKRSRSMSPPEFGSEQDIDRTKIKVENQVVPTTAPSDDHTYGTMRVEEVPESDASHDEAEESSVDNEYDFGRSCQRGSGSLVDIAKIAATVRPECPAKSSYGESEVTSESEQEGDDIDEDEEDGDDTDERPTGADGKQTSPPCKSVEHASNVILNGRRIRRPKRFYDDMSPPPPSRRSRMASKRAKTKLKIKVPITKLSSCQTPTSTRRQRKQKNPRMAFVDDDDSNVNCTDEEKRLVAEGADALLNLSRTTCNTT